MSKNNYTEEAPPGHMSDLPRVNRIAGQLAGIKKMIEEHRHCPEILTQLRAIRSALKGLEASILERHLNHCLTDSLNAGNKKDIQDKIDELKDVFKRYDE
jgi:CsoR family transcriptional regulator, copper-sensing transcriptional repressor